MTVARLMLAWMLLWGGPAIAASAQPAATVPVVDCPADGPSGPSPAPPVPAAAHAGAGQLARYVSPGLAVLAPRGWHCIASYGSGGASLLVTPRGYTRDTMPGIHGLTGPAVEMSFLNGENAGREDVADLFSCLFPFERDFIRRAAADDDVSGPRHRPGSPCAGERLVRHGRGRVDYTTPAHRQGLGTFGSRLGPGDGAIVGSAVLARSNGDENSVILSMIRLPDRLRALTPMVRRTAAGR